MNTSVGSDNLRLLWATPLLARRLEGAGDLNARLERAILALRETDPGVQRSNYGGWHSGGNLFERPEPEFEELQGVVAQAVADCVAAVGTGVGGEIDMTIFGAANVLERGGYHTYHVHTHCHLSGVYYVSTGEPDPENPKSGTICFYEPRPGGSMLHTRYLGFAEDFEVEPEPGMVLVFPAFLGHSVHPFTGAGRRITVAFNATLLD
ncbi:MAG TPA: TIGR02466 family protein [Longimicrobiaceae bacterium]|nr:TIGR02466 family protein [Longimicrobiaceae bacterium]